MITLSAKISLISGDSGSLSGTPSSFQGNNISSPIGNVIGSKKQCLNPFILSSTKLGEGATLNSGVDYFISKEISDNSGGFSSPYKLVVLGKDITSLTIAFDTVNNRHPTKIDIDGIEYADDDAIFTIRNLTKAQSHTITISDWNAPNYPLVISGVYINIDIDVGRKNLISLNRSIFYRGDNKLPSYGIISNTGNLKFNDVDGEIKDYAEQLILASDLKVYFFLNNTLQNVYEQIGVFETASWEYDNINRVVSVSLKDDLEEWQDIQVDGINYDPRKPFKIITDGKMSNIYRWLQNKERTPEKYQMLGFEELDEKTKTILENTIINYPLLESGTLWDQWQKLCEVCGLYIYKNNEGNTVCTYTYGS